LSYCARVRDFIQLKITIRRLYIKDPNKTTPHICLRGKIISCCSGQSKIARHIKIPTIAATITPITPMIMSVFAPLLLLLTFSGYIDSIFKDDSQMYIDDKRIEFSRSVLPSYLREKMFFVVLALSLSYNCSIWCVIFIILR
jgi:hypothetical protein